jgi:peptidoglycan hydrolase-like protein with peptidoglycan-binding domain
MFRPRGHFTPLSRLALSIPAGALGPLGRRGQWLVSSYSATFTVAGVSELRLQQLLAELDYLPLKFQPSPKPRPSGLPHQIWPGTNASAPASLSGIVDESTSPDTVALGAQAGSFSWRYPNIPASLTSLWLPGVDTALTQGAIMAFQSDNGLEDDGEITPAFWADLLDAVATRQVNTAPYDYLEVSTVLPETLSVWRDGKVIYETPANTGISEAPTALGTYPVYARYLSTTMSGYNPDGSYYDDPGIPDVAYFNGGDAVHGFLRASYGFPQSLGCVELPYSAAAVAFNYDPIGTLVAVS